MTKLEKAIDRLVECVMESGIDEDRANDLGLFVGGAVDALLDDEEEDE